MSNVIIGIIGVILFIGLALAGTVLLGDDFISAKASTDAAEISSHLQQISQAVQVLKVRRGVVLPANLRASLVPTLVSYNALTEAPTNPITGGSTYQSVSSAGAINTNPIGYVYAELGTSEEGRNACLQIEQTAGNNNATEVVDSPVATSLRVTQAPRLGCYMSSNSRYTAIIPAD